MPSNLSIKGPSIESLLAKLNRFPLDTKAWPGGGVLIHGPWGNGKTHLGGDAAKYMKAKYPDKYAFYVNFKGEDGYGSIQGLGIEAAGVIPVDIRSFDEYKAFLDLAERVHPSIIVLDSLKENYNLGIEKKVDGEDRAPLTGDFKTNEWPDIHSWLHKSTTRARNACDVLLALCPSDLSKDALVETETGIKQDKPKLTPDLPGKMAHGCISWFGLVGYLSLQKTATGEMKRSVDFTINHPRYLTRQRLPKFIGKVDIPETSGGFAAVVSALNESYNKGVTA